MNATLALRLLWRDWRAGELTLIAIALVIAVASVTTIGFFADRVQKTLGRQANQLLGADLVIVSDRPVAGPLEEAARARGLSVVRTMRFPSMALRGERSALAGVRVVTEGYPLRGELRVASELFGAEQRATSIPAPGTIWVDERLYTELQLGLGDSVNLGQKSFSVDAIVTQEPDAAVGFLNAAPRVLMNEADIAATGLVQPGSRIGYRLQVSGPGPAVEEYRTWAAPRLDRGQRIEGIRDARPEIRSALERAERFLHLAGLISVILAAVAIGLSARRFLQRHLDACAIMRCIGAPHSTLLKLYLTHFALLGIGASAVGCAIGAAAQALLVRWLSSLVTVELPPAGLLPAVYGLVTGIVLLIGFALPPLVALARVPALRVIRRDLGAPGGRALATYVAGYGVIAALIFWRAQELRLGAIVLGGFTGAMIAAALFTRLMLAALSGMRPQGVSWRYGFANLKRRPLATILQVIALSLGLMALLVLTLVRQDLLANWQKTLPPDAPNRFVMNILPEQIEPLRAFFTEARVAPPEFHPMVRGRLVRINDRAVSSADYAEDRARRLIDREFNLSWASELRTDNRIVRGTWFGPGAPPQFSVEEGIAETLGMRMGDALTFDIAGTPVTARVTSLRKVDWDTFNVNFFVVAPPGVLERHPAAYITSFHLKPGDTALLARMVRAFPNVVLIDVAHLMSQVQRMMEQVSRAVQFIFLFTILAGLVVLYAAIASSQDERVYQAAIMRTLGASRRQLGRALIAEFAALGALAGLLAAAGATVLGYFVATRVLSLSYEVSPVLWVTGAVSGAIAIAAAGYARTRRVLGVPPMIALREMT